VTAVSAAMARSGEPPRSMDETDTGPGGVVHVPVLEGVVVEGLRPRPGARLVDATLGAGGHAAALLAAAPGVHLLGIDRDPSALAVAAERLRPFGARARLMEGRFAELPALIEAAGWETVDGVLLDLGVSSMQLDEPRRGFSFRGDGPLDMAMGGTSRRADEVVNQWDEGDLARAISELGEEPRARAIARAIVAARPIAGTAALAAVVAAAAGRGRPHLHPATRTFQAIRIAVNEELEELDRVLEDGWRLLAPGGRFGVLSYHSLEDRRVKQAFRRWAATCLCPPGLPVCRCGWSRKVRIVAGRAGRPDADEVRRNPRARSARWRLVERLEGGR
jgi:16S rRNA (cytosine1402-N4)-methyltransferase